MRFKKYKCVYIYTQYINETHICSRKIYILMMQQSRKEIGHRMSFTYIYAYDPNSEIFTPFIWRFFFGTLYILTNIYIYTNTFHHSCYYKYFHKTEHSIGGEGVKI